MENLTQPNRDGLEVQPAELKAAMRAADTNGKDRRLRVKDFYGLYEIFIM